MNASVDLPPSTPPQHALAASIGYLLLEARREGYPLVAHMLEVALYALETYMDCSQPMSRSNRSA